eukprot:m.83729 g.83729  ORF g.83729 m.83729 type:complete len:556 (-) comp25664_c0_seq1:300-1967(-)
MATIPISSFHGPVHVAVTWPENRMHGVDIDIAALAYTADGNQLDVCYFKKPQAMNGSIGSMGDDQKNFGYSNDKEGIFVHLHLLPPECNYVFLIVSCRNGADNLQQANAGMRIADGSVPGGKFIATAPLNMPSESLLAAAIIRGPGYLYPPSWQLQITSGIPVAAGKGRDFNEAIGLIEEYLQSCIPQEMLLNRPPNNPMEKFDMNKMDAYFLDPSCTRVSMQLGWDTTCDLDVHCHLLDEWYQKEAHVYYNHLSDKGIRHSGNQRSGSGWSVGNPEEIIYLQLPELNDSVKYAVFCVHIRQGEIYYVTNNEGVQEERRHPAPSNFAGVRNCFARFVDDQANYQLANFQLNHDNMPGRTRIMCVLQRYGADRRWNLIPLGMPMQHAPDNSAAVRKELISQTRHDLLRPIRIKFGVIKGTEMKACDGKTSDPYFSCKFYDATKKRSKCIKKTLEPQWNEPVIYDWTGPIADLLERIYAKLDVYDKDMIRDDFMGRVYLHAREVIGTRGRGVIQKWLTLGDKHTSLGEQSEGVFDGLLGNKGITTGKILVQWEVTAA